MILIALGANLPSKFGTPEQTIEAAIEALEGRGVRVLQASRIWQTAPVPVSDQPWYRNAVIAVETTLEPAALFALMQQIEQEFGRVKTVRNAARLLDLDLLSYKDRVQEAPKLILPHPRMHERGFVLYPLQEITSDWIHPVSELSVAELIEKLPVDQQLLPPKSEAA